MIGPKCIHCKRQKHRHSVFESFCPTGKRTGLFEHVWNVEKTFEPKQPKKRETHCRKINPNGSRKRKNTELRRSLKTLSCLACGVRGSEFNPVDPAHVKTFKVSQSDHPSNIIPLCREHHQMQHRMGWVSLFETFAHLRPFLEKELGWKIYENPFDKQKLHFQHEEIA